MLTFRLALFSLAALATAGAVDTLKEVERKLQDRYPVVKLGPQGQTVVSPGTVLIVQIPGIRSNPATQFTFMNNFQDGRIKYSMGSSLITDRNTIRDLQPGEAVFLYKVEAKENGVVFHVQPCGDCQFSAIDPAPYRAGITFQLPKTWTQAPDPDRIDRLIGQVFQVAGPSPQPAPAAPAQPPPPSNIELGQTPEQVRAALGEPERIADLGSKKIFVYRDLKVTFLDGKVSDVQ
jgi:hypothetical protein